MLYDVLYNCINILCRYNIRLEFQTQSFNGILLYTESPLNGDYLAVYLRDGLLTYSRYLGGAETISDRIVRSNQRYSDGLIHNVRSVVNNITHTDWCVYIV